MTDLHARVIELLPWYVNETLPPEEHRLVEQHVGECLPCRRALHDERSMRTAVREADIPTAASAGLDRLLAAIDDQEGSRPQTAAAWSRPFGRRAAGALLAAAASIGFIAVVAVWIQRAAPPAGPANEFATLSTPAAASTTRIDVVFVTDASAADIAAFVEELDATVVAGPTGIGRYTLALPAGADRDAVLAGLPDNALIRFAGPSFIAEEIR